MSLVGRARAHLASRLEWRLVAVFLAAALIPLAVSDGIATGVLGGIVQRIALDRDNFATRTASRQVLDRLMLARTLLTSIDAAQGDARARLVASDIGGHGVFASVACADAGSSLAPALMDRWRAARSGLPDTVPARSAATLRISGEGSGPPALMLAAGSGQSPRCVATLDPDYVWEPLHDQSDGSTWQVRSEDGRTVFAWRGADASARASQPATRFTAHLFLAAEFGSGTWTLQQDAAPPLIAWYGMPVQAWLLCVAAITMLLIVLAARRTIRRVLLPLDVLAEGSRRLAAGIEPTRVDIRRNDELGRLADSFNAMAAQLEQRIASLRALARIDEGILAHAPFSELAGAAIDRLASLHPAAQIAIAWQDDTDRIAVLRRPAGHGAKASVLPLTADEMQAFERLADGTPSSAALPWLDTADAPAGSSWQVLGVRDGGTNRALIALRDARAPQQLAEASSLRDRLSVAQVARAREEQLQHRATHDQLTGLRNAYGLQRALEPMLAADAPFAVLFVDLDHFKDVNDCYGHSVGDALLKAAARRLEGVAPPGALVSRNGGDEFVVVLPGCALQGASELASRVLAGLGEPFILSTLEHRSGASLGIALCPAHGRDLPELLRCADIALYESKNAGRGRWTAFEPAFDVRLRERNDLLTGLDRALRRSELVVHYQPRFDTTSGAVVSAEALVRWQHPQRGLLLPGSFIELAESSGLIDALGAAVMEATIAQVGQWRREGLDFGRVSVNVSQRQFESGRLVGLVSALLERHGVPGHRLEVEVTESVLGGEIDSVCRQLQALRALGVTVAMDDFGTGYSSLSQLRRLPIDVMKIDRAFVKDVETASDAVAIARTIVTLARALELRVVAEGIETRGQADLLAAMGCDEFQGFLFSRALAPDALAALARTAAPVATS